MRVELLDFCRCAKVNSVRIVNGLDILDLFLGLFGAFDKLSVRQEGQMLVQVHVVDQVKL